MCKYTTTIYNLLIEKTKYLSQIYETLLITLIEKWSSRII